VTLPLPFDHSPVAPAADPEPGVPRGVAPVEPAIELAPTVPGLGLPVATTIRDAIYDRIPMSGPELAIIATPAFLRLDGIQQLGFVSRVWPGAKHTRFEHSLGVLHLTRLALEHLRRTPRGAATITEEDARTIAAAALLHDIGHYPFSHAIEELGPPVRTHEEVGAARIASGEIAGILRDRWGVRPERVAAIVFGGPDALGPVDRLLRGLLSGPLDMDKLDYLPRDAHGCNVPYGGVDTTRLIDALGIAAVPEAVVRHGRPQPAGERIVVGSKGISALHSLINARQAMFDNVYWHHTNRACMAMLLRAIQEAVVAGVVSADDLPRHDDASLLGWLAGPEMPEATRRLIAALVARRFHKRAVEVSRLAWELYGRLGNLFFDPAARREVETLLAEGLARETGRPVPPDAILIDIPKPETWRTGVWVTFDRPPVGFAPVMPWRDVAGMSDEDFKRYEEHRRLIRIVAAEPFREDVRRHWESLLMPLLGGVL
jgi:uncharacterized protein